MNLLLDTHVLIWWLTDPSRVPEAVRDELLDPVNEVGVSAATAWEIALKRRLGKLDFDGDFLAAFDERVRDLGFAPRAVTSAHMIRGAEIDAAHKDPFDRMLAGQALVDGLNIVTADRSFANLGVEVLWNS